MEKSLRSLARKVLPPPLRRPLGKVVGEFHNRVLAPLGGLFFDHAIRRFRADGCAFEIPRHLTSAAYRSCFLGDSYEAEERALIRKFVRPGDRVLEVGACLGIVSCVTNKLLRDPRGHVVVEGNPLCLPAIHRNREINGCDFLVENCALSHASDVTFFLHPVYIVGGSTQRGTNRPVRVPGKSLRDLEERYGPFTTLILDVEGAELESFEPAGEFLRQLRLVIVELHPWAIGEQKVERCRELLRQAGLVLREGAGLTEAWSRS